MKVIYLNLHGCRVDALGAYGSAWTSTPQFDKLATESVVFDQHYVNWLNLERVPGDAYLRILEPFLLSDLLTSIRDRGAATVLIGDERTQKSWPVLSGWKQAQFIGEDDLPALEQPTLSDGVLQTSIDWLQQYGQVLDRWLLWIDLGALLPPWKQAEFSSGGPANVGADSDEADETNAAPVFDYADLETDEPLPERFGWRTAYAGVMGYVDDLLGQFTALLRELELDKTSLLAVSSPAGQPLGERSETPQRLLGAYEERAHLPMILRLPGLEAAGRRVHHLTQASDWLATLAELFQVPLCCPVPAFDLLPLTRGEIGRLREYALSQVNQQGDVPWEVSLRTLDWHGMWPVQSENRRPPQLYRKPEDKWEMNNVISEHLDVAEHLELTMRRALAWQEQGKQSEAPTLREEIVRIVRG